MAIVETAPSLPATAMAVTTRLGEGKFSVSLFPSAAPASGSGRILVRVVDDHVRPVPTSVEDAIWPSFGSMAFPDLRHFCETAIDAFAVRVAGA